MLGLSWPALTAMAAIHSAGATASPAPLNIITPSFNMSTLTAPGEIDRRFRIVMASRGADVLPTDPGLMATAETLYQLGKSDVNGMVEPRTYMNRIFPAVSVSIRGMGGAAEIPTRFALWGIYEASDQILRTQIFRNYQFTLKYDNSNVGSIDFARTQAQANPTRNTSNTEAQTQILPIAPQTASSSPTSSRNLSLPSPLETPIQLSFSIITEMDMSKWELFANIYVTLFYIAGFLFRQRIPAHFRLAPPSSPQTGTGFWPRGASSVVEYGQVASAFSSIADYVVTSPVLSGIGFNLKLDGELIGDGIIYKAPLPKDIN
ncbi:hypothetical protein BDR22DRAFT_228791 [Usnea florida]